MQDSSQSTGTDANDSPPLKLVALARQGDRRAYAALVLWFSAGMTRSIRGVLAGSRHWKRGVRPEDVADLLQDVRVQLLEAGPRFLADGDDPVGLPVEVRFKLFARRAARSYLRSGRRGAWAERPTEVDELGRAAGRVGIEERLVARDRLRRAFHLLGGGRTPEVLLAMHVDGLSLDQVSERLSASRNSVYCGIVRFRTSVRALESVDLESGE